MKKIALLLAAILILSCSKKSEQNLATKSIEQLKIDSINEYRKKRNDSIAIKNAKNLMEKDRFSLLYAPILNVIENEILPKFDKKIIAESKILAKEIKIPLLEDY